MAVAVVADLMVAGDLTAATDLMMVAADRMAAAAEEERVAAAVALSPNLLLGCLEVVIVEKAFRLQLRYPLKLPRNINDRRSWRQRHGERSRQMRRGFHTHATHVAVTISR